MLIIKRIVVGLSVVLLLLLCSLGTTYFVRNVLYVDILAYMPKKISETSGLAIINGDVWTHNDTYSDNKFYRLNHDMTGIAQIVKVNNSRNYDWEDLAQDQQFLYVGDIGNNLTVRNGGVIYKIEKKGLNQQHQQQKYNFNIMILLKVGLTNIAMTVKPLRSLVIRYGYFQKIGKMKNSNLSNR